MKRSMVRFVLAAVAASTVAFVSGSAFAAGDAAKGKASFIKYGCWQCHGTQGQGSAITSLGKVLAPDPLPWETFSAFVRSTNRAMPPYSEKILPNGDLENIHAYLSSIPKPKDVKSIPLLSQ